MRPLPDWFPSAHVLLGQEMSGRHDHSSKGKAVALLARCVRWLLAERQHDTLPAPGRAGVSVSAYSPPTSRAAAVMAYPRSGTQRMRVLELLAARGTVGATDEEMQVRLGLGHNSQTPRRRELVLGGWVEDGGSTRPTGSTGAQATVWVLTERGKEEGGW